MLNIRSVKSKLENISDLLFNEFKLNALILTETWHERADSVVIKRLRGFGLHTIEATHGPYRRVWIYITPTSSTTVD